MRRLTNSLAVCSFAACSLQSLALAARNTQAAELQPVALQLAPSQPAAFACRAPPHPPCVPNADMRPISYQAAGMPRSAPTSPHRGSTPHRPKATRIQNLFPAMLGCALRCMLELKLNKYSPTERKCFQFVERADAHGWGTPKITIQDYLAQPISRGSALAANDWGITWPLTARPVKRSSWFEKRTGNDRHTKPCKPQSRNASCLAAASSKTPSQGPRATRYTKSICPAFSDLGNSHMRGTEAECHNARPPMDQVLGVRLNTNLF
jgi:hypothetical protein